MPEGETEEGYSGKKDGQKVVLRKSQALMNELPDKTLCVFPAANLPEYPKP